MTFEVVHQFTQDGETYGIDLSKKVSSPKGEKSYFEIFEGSYLKNFITNCDEWIGPKDRSGFGIFSYEGKLFPAHRVAWLILMGEDPKDRRLTHECKNRSCVNAHHLKSYSGLDADPYAGKAGLCGRNPRSITEYKIAQIKDMLKESVPLKEISRRTGLTQKEIASSLGIKWHHQYTDEVLKTASINDSLKDQLTHAIAGLTSEAGEVSGILRKTLYAGHPLDHDKVSEELGDVLFYLAWLMNILNLDMEDVAQNNIKKLRKRFPNGFTFEDSFRRTDTK
jgi:NTP pyrophosphatase (non-canonical NTP hydrolase)